MAKSKVSFEHADADGSFAFHKPGGELVEITASKPYATNDAGEIRFLDDARFVKRAKQAGGKEG